MRFQHRLVAYSQVATKSLILSVLALGILSACGKDPNALDQSENLPSQRTDIEGTSVDGLIIGHRLMAAEEYDLALRAYSRTIPENGLTVDVLSAIGSANLKLGRLGQAEDYLRKAIKQDDSFAPAWNNLGVILVTRGEYSEAREVFKVAYGLDRGESTEIRANLLQAEAKMQSIALPVEEEANFRLVRRGNGQYLLLGK